MKIILASGSLGRRKLLESLGLKFEVVESSVDEEKIVARDPVKMAVKRAIAKARAVAREISNIEYRISKNKGQVQIKEKLNKNIRGYPLAIRGNPSIDRRNIDDVLIIGADTVGYQGSWVFNKPKSRAEAEEMLGRLSGKTHKYVSAHCIVEILSNTNKYYPILTNTNKEESEKVKVKSEKLGIRKNPLEIRMNPIFVEKITDYDISSVTFRKLTKADIGYYLDHVDYLKLCGGLKIMGSPQNFVVKTEGSISNIIGLSLEKLIPIIRKFSIFFQSTN